VLQAIATSTAQSSIGSGIAGGTGSRGTRTGHAGIDTGKTQLMLGSVIIEAINAFAEIGCIESSIIGGRIASEALVTIGAGIAGIVTGWTELVGIVIIIAIQTGTDCSWGISEVERIANQANCGIGTSLASKITGQAELV
jgi:hypothetical protein